MTREFWAAMAAAGQLGACSDVGGQSFGQMVNRYDALVDDYNAATLVDPSTLPNSGSASYSGQMWMETGAGGLHYPQQFVGNLAMTTRFGATAQPVTGSVTGIRDDTDAAWDGSFAIADGFLDRTADPRFDSSWGAEMTGTVTRDDGATARLVDTILRGNFSDHGALIGGGIDGAVRFQGSGRSVENPIGLAGVVGARD